MPTASDARTRPAIAGRAAVPAVVMTSDPPATFRHDHQAGPGLVARNPRRDDR